MYASVRSVGRALAGVVFLAIVLLAGPASAHAELEETSPGANQVLAVAPDHVELRWEEGVTLVPGSVRVFAPDGSRADDGAVTRANGDPATATVGIHATERGTYLVSWRVVSDDSHPVSGAFTFSVVAASVAPQAGTITTDRLVSVVSGVIRWLGYAGSALLLGGLAFCLLCWPGGLARTGVRRTVMGGGALLALSAALALLVKGPLDAGFGLSAVGRWTLLREVLDTTFGRATVVRLVAAVLGIGIVALWRRRRIQAPAAVVLALVVAASFAASGHAVAGMQRPAALVADSVHVLGASIWLGGLVLLLGWGLRAPGAADLARRFSRVALVVVCAMVVTGLYQAWRQVGSIGALASTHYGRELGVKALLVAVAVAAASISRSVVPRWSSDPSSVSVLRRSVLIEVLLLAAVLGVTSALVTTEPARTAYRPTVNADVTIGGDTVQVWTVPNGERRVQVHLAVRSGAGRPVDPGELSATASLPARDVGPLPVPLTPAGTGHSVGEVQVPVAGDWRLAVTLGGASGDPRYVDVPIR